jgi:Amt family ammonium transporter
LLTAFFATVALGGFGLAEGVGAMQQFLVQLLGVVSVAAWSAIVTAIIVLAVRALTGLRVTPDEEIEGLDIVAHGERGYDL